MTTQTIYVCTAHSVLLGCDLSTIFYDELSARQFQAQNGGTINALTILVENTQLI